KDISECIRNEFNENNYHTEAEKKETRIKDNECKSYIVQCLEDNQIDLVRDKSTAYIACGRESDLEIFLSEFEEIICQLKVTRAELKEEDLICILLLTMPSFETAITILENMKNDELTLEKGHFQRDCRNRRRGGVRRQQWNDRGRGMVSVRADQMRMCKDI
ncbi:hypothetical protein PV326_011188, partial [Microctonus aethiopoides]